MKTKKLSCGYTMIPYIFLGKINSLVSEQDRKISKLALKKLQHARLLDRMTSNYSYDKLHLHNMFSYSILYDTKKKLPVLLSGVQRVGASSARMFSRYFLFHEYRTNPSSSSLLDKVDNFEVFQEEIKTASRFFLFFFWSRDKSGNFFQKIKKDRSDIFKDWKLFNKKIELMYKGNFQSIFYLNLSSDSPEKIITDDLIFKKDSKI